MYKMILIEDEIAALQYLGDLYDWEDFGFLLAGCFPNGEEASDYLKRNPVDLVISDIKMPLKSGLELAKSCQELYPDTWFIFLSAYRDFSYAQEATKYNVIDYLTKPLDLSAFEAALHQAYKRISVSRSSFADSSLLSLRQGFFSHILCDTHKSPRELSAEMERIQLDKDILDRECALLTLHFKEFQSFMEHTWKYGLERLYNALSFLLPANPNLFCSLIRYSSDTAEFVCFNKNGSPSFQADVERYIEQFERNITEFLHPAIDPFLIQFFSSFSEMRVRALNQNNAFTAKSILDNAIAYIKAHYTEPITLKEVAEHVSLNHIYFSAFFKQHTNENFSYYVQRLRLNKALSYLRDTDLPVTAICEMVGYKNITHLYNLIKAQTNMTPNEYRLQFLDKETGHAQIP